MKIIITENRKAKPVYLSSEDFMGRAVSFCLRDEINYISSYKTKSDYIFDLRILLSGAIAALDNGNDSNLLVNMNPFGGKWAEWMLPMWGWTTSNPIDTGWDQSVIDYATQFTRNILTPDYSGVCDLYEGEAGLLFCLDSVMRNLAPYSWLVTNPRNSLGLYFHNSLSFVVGALREEDLEEAIKRVKSCDHLTIS